MQIQFNTDHTVDGNERVAAHVASVVRDELGSLAAHVTRVEVHLSDQAAEANSGMRCVMEARLEGRQPIAVSQQSGSVHQAVAGASKKLGRVVSSALRSRPNAG